MELDFCNGRQTYQLDIFGMLLGYFASPIRKWELLHLVTAECLRGLRFFPLMRGVGPFPKEVVTVAGEELGNEKTELYVMLSSVR